MSSSRSRDGSATRRERNAAAAGPDRQAALEQYRRRAAVYDLELALFEPLRQRAVAALQLRAGQTVIDVGCGTGLSLPLLQDAVGAHGHVIGIEQSLEMIERARQRAHGRRAGRVTLLHAPAEAARIAGPAADAALFHFTHDVLRRPQALAHVLRHVRPGGRVAATGLKWAQGARRPVNLLVWSAARRSVTTFDGLDRPWSLLESFTGPLAVDEFLFGAVFVAYGQVIPPRAVRADAGTGRPLT